MRKAQCGFKGKEIISKIVPARCVEVPRRMGKRRKEYFSVTAETHVSIARDLSDPLIRSDGEID